MARYPLRCMIVFGALRSGTTLIRLMLDGHAHLSCKGETDFLFDHAYDKDGVLHVSRAALEHDRIFRGSGLPLPPTDIPLTDYLSDALERLSENGTAMPVLMLHRNLARAIATLPDALYVHMLRDPRDVARSSIKLGAAGNTWFGVDHWIKSETEWAANCADIPSPTFDLRYEMFVARAQEGLAELCAFAGLDYDPNMLSYPEATTYAAPDPSLAEQWRRKQSDRDVRLVETKLGPMLGERGFAHSGLPPLTPDAAMLRKLRRQDRAFRIRWRAGKYGWGLTLGEMFARKLRIGTAQRALERRIQARLRRQLR